MTRGIWIDPDQQGNIVLYNNICYNNLSDEHPDMEVVEDPLDELGEWDREFERQTGKRVAEEE